MILHIIYTLINILSRCGNGVRASTTIPPLRISKIFINIYATLPNRSIFFPSQLTSSRCVYIFVHARTHKHTHAPDRIDRAATVAESCA